MTEKSQCNKCGTFDKNTKGECIVCVKKYMAEWRLKNPSPRTPKNNDIAKKPCIKCGACDRYANGACKPCSKSMRASWHSLNKEYANSTSREWRNENKERKKLVDEAWRNANRERVKANVSSWANANKDLVRIAGQNRRAKKRASGRLSKDIAKKLFKLQKGKCACCGEHLGNNYHLDHIMPLARGGTNTDENIQLLTAICNQKKSAKHPIDYMQEHGYLL